MEERFQRGTTETAMGTKKRLGCSGGCVAHRAGQLPPAVSGLPGLVAPLPALETAGGGVSMLPLAMAIGDAATGHAAIGVAATSYRVFPKSGNAMIRWFLK